MHTAPAALPQQRKPRGRDRRCAKREPLDTRGQLIRCPASSRTAPLDVQFSDQSATGVGIVHHEPLPVGQKYVVKEPSISRRKNVLFTVVRADKLDDARFSIGLHASHLLEDGYVHSERQPVGRKVPVVLLILAIGLGVAGAMLFL